MKITDTIHTLTQPVFKDGEVFAMVHCKICGQHARIYKFDTTQIFYYDGTKRLYNQPPCGGKYPKKTRSHHSFVEYKRDEDFSYKKCECGVECRLKHGSTFVQYFMPGGEIPYLGNKAEKCNVEVRIISDIPTVPKRHKTVPRSFLKEQTVFDVVKKDSVDEDRLMLNECYVVLNLLADGEVLQAKRMAKRILQSDNYKKFKK